MLRLEFFNTYWDILKRNYMDKTHNEKDKIDYFSIFRKYEEEDFKRAIEKCLLNQPYFPRVDEIAKYLPIEDEENVPKWLNENLQIDHADEEDIVQMDKLLSEIEARNEKTK